MTERATGPEVPDRIVLIGFMGSGKSTVGALLAKRLGWELVYLDTLVETRTGRAVAAIFATQGEDGFRELESACLRDLASRDHAVIATGGGAPTRDANRWYFRNPAAAVFHLHVSLAEALTRTRSDASRPLLAQPAGEVRRLYEARLPAYRELGMEIGTDGKAPEEVAAEIAARFASVR
jgi:shikimate kinase